MMDYRFSFVLCGSDFNNSFFFCTLKVRVNNQGFFFFSFCKVNMSPLRQLCVARLDCVNIHPMSGRDEKKKKSMFSSKARNYNVMKMDLWEQCVSYAPTLHISQYLC